MPAKQLSVTTPGKVILLGEHSVLRVGGALAIPFFGMGMRCKIKTLTPSSPLLWYGVGKFPVPVTSEPFVVNGLEGLAQMIRVIFASVDKPLAGYEFKLFNQGISGAGLGSSASSAVALAVAFHRMLNITLKPRELANWIQIAETYAHQRSSGVDSAVIRHQHPIYYQMDKPAERLTIPHGFYPLVVYSGVSRQAAKPVGISLKANSSHHEELALLVESGKQELYKGDYQALGHLFNQAHSILSDLGVSHPQLDTLVTALRAQGVLGAKLTGAGMGGCAIALCKDPEHLQYVREQLNTLGYKHNWAVKYQ
jgi:mevalonate kinase